VKGKKLSVQAITGEKGVNLVQRIVLDMKSRWSPTAALDVGIDGTIELCDPETGAALGHVVLVQSKPTAGRFQSETDGGFDFLCDARDIEYWMQGNAPVILVVSRPADGEAYWISIKEYFQEPAVRATRKVRFDKARDRFDASAFPRLLKIATPKELGLYLAPPARHEQLVSNLLQVAAFPGRVYTAESAMTSVDEIWQSLRARGEPIEAEWVLKSKRLWGFNDLSGPSWRDICDRGTIEEFDVEEWSLSDDPDRQRDFVWLLNTCLRRKLYPRIRFRKELDCYVYLPSHDMGPDAVAYERPSRIATRTVFKAYRNGKTAEIAYYRHAACQMQFRRFGDGWFLEVDPTYVFTTDGDKLHWDQAGLLSGIKRLDRNQAVYSLVLMWADVIKRAGSTDSQPYPHLAFSDLAAFGVEVGIDDKTWAMREDADGAERP